MGDEQSLTTARPAARKADHQPPPQSRTTSSRSADDFTTVAERALDAVAQRLASSPGVRVATAQRRALNRGIRGVGAAPTVQRAKGKDDKGKEKRAPNPHGRGGDHQGWELTDHHIIAHSKLGEALGKLRDDQKRTVLASVIPTTLTVEMLDKVSVKVAGDDIPGQLQAIRLKLIDPDYSETIGNQRPGDIRQAFFEWMGGNQFAGPNTSIRPEPTANKDDIDTDGQFFGNAPYADLKAKADVLYSALNTHKQLELQKETAAKRGKSAKPQVSADVATEDPTTETPDPIAASQDAIAAVLLDIAKIAKDVPPGAFDPSQWVEINSIEKLQLLAANKVIGRDHVTSYAYFKMKVPTQPGPLPPPYEEIKSENAGLSQFAYGSVKEQKPKVGGGWMYFGYEASKSVRPTVETPITVRAALVRLAQGAGKTFDAVVKKAGGATVKLEGLGDKVKTAGQLIKLEGFNGAIASTNLADLEFAEADLDAGIKEPVPTAPSLHDYLAKRNTPVSSWLPKALHESLSRQIPSACEENLHRAQQKEWHWAGLLAGAQKQPPSERVSKTIALRTRQLADAQAAVANARKALQESKAFWGQV